MRWSYKTIHYELKKDGILGSAFLDEPEIELSLNQYGKAGWELVSLLETLDGLIAVFKQPLDLDSRPFTALSDSAVKREMAVKEPQEKREAPHIRLKEKNDVERMDDGVAEAMLLDEFEIVEEKTEKSPAKSSKPPVDAGSIRIE